METNTRHPQETPTIDAKTLAAAAAHLADEKKAENVKVVAVDEQLKIADYFVIATGQNRNHVRAIYDEIHVRLKAAGERHRPVEGADLGWWIVMDYGDVVVHVLQGEAREYYDIDRFYGECEQMDWGKVELPELPEGRRAQV